MSLPKLSDRSPPFQRRSTSPSSSPRWTWWPTAALPRWAEEGGTWGPPAEGTQPPSPSLCFAERGGRRAPGAADRAGAAAVPGADSAGAALGDVSARHPLLQGECCVECFWGGFCIPLAGSAGALCVEHACQAGRGLLPNEDLVFEGTPTQICCFQVNFFSVWEVLGTHHHHHLPH